MRHVIAIDQGTTGTTVLVLDEALAVSGRGYQEFRQIYPTPGWVDHYPEDIWSSVTAALELLRDNPDPSDEEIRAGLSGNLCMCTGYVNIVRAVRAVAGDGKVR